MRRARNREGSVVFNRRSRTWHFLWCEDKHRRSKLIGSLREYPTKASARRAAEPFRYTIEKPATGGLTVKTLAERYEAERLPSRFSTARMYRSWLRNHIVPFWGDKPMTELQPRAVELWLQHLRLSPKSKAHVRAMLRILVEFAMWSGVMEISRNPIELVVVKGATKRTRQPRSLTAEDFQKLVEHLDEPFRLMARVAVCFGLRVSELLALKWTDVDWLNRKLHIERAIVMQNVDEVKTVASRRQMTIDADVLEVLKASPYYERAVEREVEKGLRCRVNVAHGLREGKGPQDKDAFMLNDAGSKMTIWGCVGTRLLGEIANDYHGKPIQPPMWQTRIVREVENGVHARVRQDCKRVGPDGSLWDCSNLEK